jgi:predicted F0F1-ATPase subunit
MVWSGDDWYGWMGYLSPDRWLDLALGIWIDSTWPSRVPWTLTLLLVGTGVGYIKCLVLGHARVERAIEQERDERKYE